MTWPDGYAQALLDAFERLLLAGFCPLTKGRYGSILLKKSDFQLAGAQAGPPPENLITTLSGFSALR